MRYEYVAISGIPGSGKTTLARGICESRGWWLLSTGDIARQVDPDGLAAGGLADEDLFRAAFVDTLQMLKTYSPVVLDGIPRSKGQLELLPEGTKLIGLTCRADIARDRLLRRQREDDTPDLVDRRIVEQAELLEVNQTDGWLYRTAGWGAVVNTSQKKPAVILRDVLAYLDAVKPQAF